jgi:hypothetical protein
MTRPLRIGLVADVQYGDKPDDGRNTYRAALDRLRAVVDQLNAADLDLVVQLGDVIDGTFDRPRHDAARDERDLDAVLAVLDGLAPPLEHVVGNHGLSLPRERLLERLGPAAGHRVRDVGPARLVFVDTLAFARVGRRPEDPVRVAAEAWLAAHDVAEHPHAHGWNGGLGEAQRAWLREVLAADDRPAVVLAHHPVDPAACRPKFLAWDHAEALAVVDAAPRCVAWVNGHDHRGGRDERNGVLHATVPGLVAATGPVWARLEVGADDLAYEVVR